MFPIPGGRFFTPFFVKSTSKISRISRISNTLSETLRTYTFLIMVFIVDEIKSIILKVWETKSRNAMLDVRPQDNCCR